jgi:hypothetical protein
VTRRVRLVLLDPDRPVGEAEGRAAEAMALLLAHAARVNQRGVRKVILTQTPVGLKLVLNLRAPPLPDCAGMESG